MFATCSSEVLSVKLTECLVAQRELGTVCRFSSLSCGICFGEDNLKGMAVRNTQQCSLIHHFQC